MNKITVQKQRQGYNREPAASSPHRFDSVSTVESVVTKALKNSANKMGLGNTKAIIARLQESDSVAFSYCNHSIAKQLGAVLGLLDKNIKAVYICDYDDATPEDVCFCEAPPVSLVHLIIWVECKTKAVDALVAAMDHAMVQHYSHMLGLHDLQHVLDVQVIDNEDVRSRTGFGALLQSVYQPPIQVWRSALISADNAELKHQKRDRKTE